VKAAEAAPTVPMNLRLEKFLGLLFFMIQGLMIKIRIKLLKTHKVPANTPGRRTD
jgi:hypothetical protein